jgi:hypothetical protein
MHRTFEPLIVIAIAWIFVSTGCSPFYEAPPKYKQEAEAFTVTETGETVPSGLLELSSADRRAAESQEKCPVTGTILGTTGKPHKFKYQGRVIYVDCKGSEPTFRSDPEYYLAKLPEE